MQDNGGRLGDRQQLNANLASPGGTSTDWTLPIDLPTAGDYSVTAYAYDTAGQQETSTSGATARYRYYPDDLPPSSTRTWGRRSTGRRFTEGKIVVTGRAEDDLSIARVDMGASICGQYMALGRRSRARQPSCRSAFLNSPGSPGSNFSYTTPVIPDGTYSVDVRATDSIDKISDAAISTGVTLTRPAEQRSGGRPGGHVQPERLRVRRSWIDERERGRSDVRVELRDRPGHGHRLPSRPRRPTTVRAPTPRR